MVKKHKHHDLIVQWAKGASIQILNKTSATWEVDHFPHWCEHESYRLYETATHIPFTVKDLEDQNLVVRLLDTTVRNKKLNTVCKITTVNLEKGHLTIRGTAYALGTAFQEWVLYPSGKPLGKEKTFKNSDCLKRN